jgi:cytoskeletal protein CcmA (bactofilin family)
MSVFGKKQKDLVDSHIATVISDGCKIDGNISSESSVRVDGIVNGNISIQQGVIVGNSGKVLGNVTAKEAVIFGVVNGNISTEKLEIKSTGKITGDISTQSLEMDFGAVYNGKVSMTTNGNSSHSIKKEQSNGVLLEN